MIHIWQCFS